MAAPARMVLSCLKKVRFFHKVLLARTYLDGSSCTSKKNAFQLHFPDFKNKISMSAAVDPVGDRNSNSENADVKCYSLLQCFFLVGLVCFCAFYSSAFLYGEDGTALSVIAN